MTKQKLQTDCDGCEFPEQYPSHSCGKTCCDVKVEKFRHLLLDEIGKHKNSRTTKEILDSLVDYLQRI